MKATMGQVRAAIRAAKLHEAKPRWDSMSPKERAFDRGIPYEEKLDHIDDLRVGEWVVTRGRNGEQAGPIKSIYTVYRKDQEPYTMIMVSYGSSSSGRRYDLWRSQDYVGPATADDIQKAKEAWAAENAYMSRHIDTSRQGT